MTTSADSNPHAPTAALWQQLSPRMQRAFHCRCARPVFFGNTRCLACRTELGYDADSACVVPIEPVDGGSG
jgi:hypothetical protein